MQSIKTLCYSMKEGQSVVIERNTFCDAFSHGYPNIHDTPQDAFLSSMIGSSVGIWRVRQCPETGNFIISRHKPSDRRFYVDCDRRHLFEKQPDGTLVLKSF